MKEAESATVRGVVKEAGVALSTRSTCSTRSTRSTLHHVQRDSTPFRKQLNFVNFFPASNNSTKSNVDCEYVGKKDA